MVALKEFLPYLKSIFDVSHGDTDWGARYIPTQGVLPLQVQTLESFPAGQNKAPGQKKREQFAVLDALRKYSLEHVLLVGKPGSGKSTALRRLQWEDAECCIQAIENKKRVPAIPIFLELRSLETSVEKLLQETLEWFGIDLEEKPLKKLIRDKQLLLLLDGVNELPNKSTLTILGQFRRSCMQAKVPLILTTRKLGAGLDLEAIYKVILK